MSAYDSYVRAAQHKRATGSPRRPYGRASQPKPTPASQPASARRAWGSAHVADYNILTRAILTRCCRTDSHAALRAHQAPRACVRLLVYFKLRDATTVL